MNEDKTLIPIDDETRRKLEIEKKIYDFFVALGVHSYIVSVSIDTEKDAQGNDHENYLRAQGERVPELLEHINRSFNRPIRL
jgi:hypothetical protein